MVDRPRFHKPMMLGLEGGMRLLSEFLQLNSGGIYKLTYQKSCVGANLKILGH